MDFLQRLRLHAVSQGLLLLALASTLLACGLPGGQDVQSRRELLREGARLQRLARSVRRGRSAPTPSRESEAGQGGRPAPALQGLRDLLPGLAFAQALAPDAAVEAGQLLLDVGAEAGLHELGLPAGSPFTRRTLADLLPEPRRLSLLPVALKRRGGGFLLEPPPGTRLRKGDVLLVLGSARAADALRRKLRS